MALFPVFMELKGKKCVVAGGGNVASRKVETLLAFEADVVVISPDASVLIREFEKSGRLEIVKREYGEGDLDGAFLAIAATSDRKANERVCSEAKTRGVLVNVADSQEDCTFSFPSVVKRGELVIGISTSGGFPSLSKNMRKRIEAVVPESCGVMLEKLKACRKKAEEGIACRKTRKKVLERIMDEVMLCSTEKDLKEIDERIENILNEHID